MVDTVVSNTPAPKAPARSNSTVISTPGPAPSDETSAATKIESLLDMKGSVLPVSADDEVEDGPDTPAEYDAGDDESADFDEPADVADQETDPSDDQADEPETTESSIDPPASWSAQEKKLFATLPPEVQSTIARRESERDTATNRGMQQIAEARKAIEAHTAQASQERNQYANTINSLLNWMVPELQEYENTDWMKLASENRDEYIRRQAGYNDLKQRAQVMQAEVGKVQQVQQQQMQQQFQAHLNQQFEVLVNDVPEFRDERKANALIADINRTMANYNFSKEEVAGITDARVVKAIIRLSQYDKAEAAKKSALTKRTGTPAPRVMPVSSSQQSDDQPSRRKVGEQFARLKRSGSPQDAARLIEQLL